MAAGLQWPGVLRGATDANIAAMDTYWKAPSADLLAGVSTAQFIAHYTGPPDTPPSNPTIGMQYPRELSAIWGEPRRTRRATV